MARSIISGLCSAPKIEHSDGTTSRRGSACSCSSEKIKGMVYSEKSAARGLGNVPADLGEFNKSTHSCLFRFGAKAIHNVREGSAYSRKTRVRREGEGKRQTVSGMLHRIDKLGQMVPLRTQRAHQICQKMLVFVHTRAECVLTKHLHRLTDGEDSLSDCEEDSVC